MQAFHRNQLEQLLKHAKQNGPFYGTRLDTVFKKNGDIDWRHWHEIPIVRRHHLVNECDSLLARELPKGHGATWQNYSSGSTGTPITTTHNSLQGLISEAALCRSQRWYEMDWSKTLVSWRGHDENVGSWPEGQELLSWASSWSETGRGQRFSIDRFASEEKVVEFTLRKQAVYFTGRPQSLQSIALAAERLNREVKLDVVVTHGSEISDDECEDCRRTFGARVLSLYTSGEAGKIATPVKPAITITSTPS